MSETITADPVDAPVLDVDTPAPETVEAPATTEPPAPEPKPSQKDRRFAHLTAKLGDASRRAEEAEARARALEEMIAARGTEAAPETKPQPALKPDEIRAAAASLLEQERFEERRLALIGDGIKDFGEDGWQDKTTILHEFGATANPAFMQAITELPEGAKIVAALADDVDQLEALLKKSPAAMAAHLGRMSAQLEQTPKKPLLSNAPKPVAPVGGSAKAEADPSKMSMKEYAAWREKTAPRSLGGRKKA